MRKLIRNELINTVIEYLLQVYGGVGAPSMLYYYLSTSYNKFDLSSLNTRIVGLK